MSVGTWDQQANRLDSIAEEYPRAEVTLLWAHERGADRHFTIFAVTELCPAEQPASGSFGSAAGHSTLRRAVGRHLTYYAIRQTDVAVPDALRFHREKGARRIPGETVDLEAAGTLAEEPPNEIPLLAGSEDPIRAVLPSRATTFRLWSRLDTNRATAARLEVLAPQALDELRAFSKEVLQFDLTQTPEHIGSLHLVASNPLIRGFDERLLDNGGALGLRWYLRKGKSLEGCRLELTDLRPNAPAFSFSFPIKSPFLVIPLPAEPYRLRMRLFDSKNRALEDSAGAFIKSIDFTMNIVGAQRVIKDASNPDDPSGTRRITVVHPERTAAPESTLAPTFLADAGKERLWAKLEEERKLVFFAGGDASRERARTIIRELLSEVQERCMIVDPYFSAKDLVDFAPHVEVARLPIRILGSWAFLRHNAAPGRSRAAQLHDVIADLQRQDRTMNIECRIASGRSKSPFHDRLLMIDERLYLVGSSFNEFGSRATTLVLCPAPDQLRRHAERLFAAAAPLTASRSSSDLD